MMRGHIVYRAPAQAKCKPEIEVTFECNISLESREFSMVDASLNRIDHGTNKAARIGFGENAKLSATAAVTEF